MYADIKKPVMIAISGKKNSGKTTLITRLIPLLLERGLKVATIKHDGHFFSPDVPGTDSFRHLAAGACGAAVFDGEKFMLTRMIKTDEMKLADFFPDANLILIEGLKDSSYPKLELIRNGTGEDKVCRESSVFAYATDLPAGSIITDKPVLDLNCPEEIAEAVIQIILTEDNMTHE